MAAAHPLGPTKAEILKLLLAEPGTATEIASNLHIQVSAARKHLEQLATLGIVEDTFQRGEVGRPKKFYALTEKGREYFPHSYDILLNHVISGLVKREGAERAESMIKTIAADAVEYLDASTPRTVIRLQQALASINKLGFEATLNYKDGNLLVTSRNCPLWNVASEQREIVCRGFHAELLKLSLNGLEVERKEWLVDKDNCCKHSITPRPITAGRITTR